MQRLVFLTICRMIFAPPMNAVLGYAQLMKDELKENELSETSDHLEKLQLCGTVLL